MTALVSGISVTCFAASYAVAWALEISRLFFRSGVRGAVMIGFAAAGLLAQTLYLAYRAAQAPASPLSSNFDWCLLAAWWQAICRSAKGRVVPFRLVVAGAALYSAIFEICICSMHFAR